jgi:hypothetical protein
LNTTQHQHKIVKSDSPIVRRRRAHLLLPHRTVQFDEFNPPSRHHLEQFISTCFKGEFEADVHSHLPYLLSAYSGTNLTDTITADLNIGYGWGSDTNIGVNRVETAVFTGGAGLTWEF